MYYISMGHAVKLGMDNQTTKNFEKDHTWIGRLNYIFKTKFPNSLKRDVFNKSTSQLVELGENSTKSKCLISAQHKSYVLITYYRSTDLKTNYWYYGVTAVYTIEQILRLADHTQPIYYKVRTLYLSLENGSFRAMV